MIMIASKFFSFFKGFFNQPFLTIKYASHLTSAQYNMKVFVFLLCITMIASELWKLLLKQTFRTTYMF